MIPFFSRPRPSPLSLAEQLEQRLTVSKKKRILFVDDDRLLQELMDRVKEKMSVEVVAAGSAGEARTLIQSRAFDLAILDVGIVNGDGIALYRWIMDNFPRMSVIFLTGGSLDAVCPKVHAIGSAPVYAKPSANTLTFLTDMLRYCGANPV